MKSSITYTLALSDGSAKHSRAHSEEDTARTIGAYIRKEGSYAISPFPVAEPYCVELVYR